MIRSTGGKKLWNPTYADQIDLWLDSSDRSSMDIDGSGGVSLWRDKSGNGNDFTQVTSSNRPKVGTRRLNGVQVVEFDGSNDTLYKFGGTVAFNVFEIHTVTDLDSGSFQKFFKGTSSGLFDYSLNTSNNIGLDAGTSMSANTPHSMVGPNIHGCAVNGGGSQIYTRGSTRNTANAGNGSWGSDCWIGSDTGSFAYMDGSIGDIICYSKNDGYQRQLCEGYLAWKYGLQWQLSSTHPFKNHPPYVENIL